MPAATAAALVVLMVASHNSPLLTHIANQGAPRAASRLGAAPSTSASTGKRPFVALQPITVVDNDAAVCNFIDAMRSLPEGSTLAIDAEWKPDVFGQSPHSPSLCQLATADDVWLVDLESTTPLDGALAALADTLASDSVRVLGFGLQHDLDKLQRCFPDRTIQARRVVDLRDVTAGGLSGLLARLAGQSLDKTQQTSDWSRRPLTPAQIRYAAADAACLLLVDALLADTAAAIGADARVSRAILTANAVASGHGADAKTADPDAAAVHADALQAVRAAVAAAVKQLGSGSQLVVVDASSQSADLSGRLEVNALCFSSPVGPLLVLAPADERVDTRWLALLLRVPRRKVKLASVDDCVARFGAIAGVVPPVPLRDDVTVLCHPRLVTPDADTPLGLWASAGHPAHRLLIDAPRTALPALAGMPSVDEITTVDGVTPLLPVFAWLPPPSLWHATLEDALEHAHSMRDGGPVFVAAHDGPLFSFEGGPRDTHNRPPPEGPPPVASDKDNREAEEVEAVAEKVEAVEEAPSEDGVSVVPAGLGLIVDQSLSVLARKLRMVGIDTRVAGEVVKTSLQPGMMISPAVAAAEAAAAGEAAKAAGDEASLGRAPQQRQPVGLLRVGIDASKVTEHLVRGALEGRLIITSAKRAEGLPGAAYRLLATDAGGQFAEVLAVLGVSDAVEAGGSRCGICNGDEWHTLRPRDVEAGQVPAAVLASQQVFYRCGVCQQIFWPGDKYESTMEGLRAEGRDQGRDEPPAQPPRAGTAGGIWRPPSGVVDGAPSATASIAREARMGTLHSTQRMQFGLN